MCRGSTPSLNIKAGDMCDTEFDFTMLMQIRMSSVLKIVFSEKCTKCHHPPTQITLNTQTSNEPIYFTLI